MSKEAINAAHSLKGFMQADSTTQAVEMAMNEIKTLRNDLKHLSQWVVDLDEGEFMDDNDCDYFNGVDEAKAHLRDLAT